MWKEYPITEASREPQSHFSNAPRIFKDFLYYFVPMTNTAAGPEENGIRVDNDLEVYEASGA